MSASGFLSHLQLIRILPFALALITITSLFLLHGIPFKNFRLNNNGDNSMALLPEPAITGQRFLPNTLRSKPKSVTIPSLLSNNRHGNHRKYQYILPKIVFCAVWRNIEISAKDNVPKFIALAKTITREFHFVFYENDSTDNTRDELLNQCGGNTSICTILVQDNVPGANDHLLLKKELGDNYAPKTLRLAKARNIVLEYAEQHYAHYDYMVMMDPDIICSSDWEGDYDPNIFKYVIWELGDQWDVLTFRQIPYYDWWAFRHPVVLPYNFLFKGQDNPYFDDFDIYEHNLTSLFDNASSWPNGLIEVESSFSIFAIYRMSLLNGTARYRGYEEDGTTDCEHTAFHFDLRLKMNARHRLSHLVYCFGATKNSSYRPLPSYITDQWRDNSSTTL